MIMRTNEVKTHPLMARGISILVFHDFGVEITEEFEALYTNAFASDKFQLTQDFCDRSKELFLKFDKQDIISLSDRYFENFTPITETLMSQGRYKIAFDFWNQILYFVKEWECQNSKKLHKGTPYYFSSIAALLSKDLDAALIFMHLALEDDKINKPDYRETPAYYFLTLNNQKPNQYAKEFVDGMIGFLRDRLDGQGAEGGRYKDHYQATRGGSLTYENLRQKFLDNKIIPDEIRYFFTYSVIRLWRLRILQKLNIGDDIVAPIIFTQALGGILITIESLLKLNGSTSLLFGNLFKRLARNEGWQAPSLEEINSDRDDDFDNWINNCLGEKTLFGDFSLSHGLRNFAFHTIKSRQKLWQDYTNILQSIWNCFFKAVEII